MNSIDRLKEQLGKTDIYFLDLLLSGEVNLSGRALDAGCGRGRNMELPAKAGMEIHGLDESHDNIAALRECVSTWGVPEEHLHHGRVGQMPFDDEMFSLVICNAVLHFARNEDHFGAMVRDLWRVLEPGGILFCRLASTVGLEGLLKAAPSCSETKWFLLPDGSERFLVDEEDLRSWTRALGGIPLGPLKTVHVHGKRSMTNWVLRRPAR